jgi:hypothetical protein
MITPQLFPNPIHDSDITSNEFSEALRATSPGVRDAVGPRRSSRTAHPRSDVSTFQEG